MASPKEKVEDTLQKSHSQSNGQSNGSGFRAPAHGVPPSALANPGSKEMPSLLADEDEDDYAFISRDEDEEAAAFQTVTRGPSKAANGNQAFASSIDYKDQIKAPAKAANANPPRFRAQEYALPNMSDDEQLARAVRESVQAQSGRAPNPTQPNQPQNKSAGFSLTQENPGPARPLTFERKVPAEDKSAAERKKNLDEAHPLTKKSDQIRSQIIEIQETIRVKEKELSINLENFYPRKKIFVETSEVNMQTFKDKIAAAERILLEASKSSDRQLIEPAQVAFDNINAAQLTYIKNSQQELQNLNLMDQQLKQIANDIEKAQILLKSLERELEKAKQQESAEDATRKKAATAPLDWQRRLRETQGLATQLSLSDPGIKHTKGVDKAP